jgi:hypothetical protein
LLKLLKLAASIDFDPRQSGKAMAFTANAIIASARQQNCTNGHARPGSDPGMAAGRIDEVARYCESDVLNAFRVWLIHELFRAVNQP